MQPVVNMAFGQTDRYALPSWGVAGVAPGSGLLIWAANVVTPNGLNIRGYSSIRVAPPPDPLPQKVRGKGIS